MSATPRFQAARSASGDAILIKASGACTLTACPALKSFLAPIRRPEIEACYLDLSDVGYVDSTFTGLLLSLSKHAGHPESPDLKIVSPAPRVVDTIRSMHLETFFDVAEAMPGSDGAWQEIAITNSGCAPLAELLVDSHKEIVEADERNRAEFGRVVEGFESELNRAKKNERDS